MAEAEPISNMAPEPAMAEAAPILDMMPDIVVAEAAPVLDMSPERKRLRLQDVAEGAEAEWDELMGRGFNVAFVPDKEDDPTTLRQKTEQVCRRLDVCLAGWEVQPTPAVKSALQLVALYLDMQSTWDPKSDTLLACVVGLLTTGVLRAHSDSVRRYSNGAWCRIATLPSDVVDHINAALQLARYACLALAHGNVNENWDEVFEFLQQKSDWNMFRPVNDFSLAAKHWAAAAGRAMGGLPWRISSVSHGTSSALQCFAVWFQEKVPLDVLKLNFTDATLEFARVSAEGRPNLKAIPKTAENECYQHLNVELGWDAPDTDKERMRVFLHTSYAGNLKGRLVVDCAECLGLANAMIVPRQIFLQGVGGNAKSMLSTLRHNVAGGNHAFVSPTVFEQVDEFRVQSGHFAHMRLLTVQEFTSGARLLDSVWKSFVSGEELASRPNYGRTTEMYEWGRAAKFWELNMEAPSIKVRKTDVEGLTPFTRRMWCVTLHSQFTGDPNLVNHAKHIYLADPTLREFLASPTARHIRMRDHLLPLMQEYSAKEMQDYLANPDMSIVEATLALAMSMANGGLGEGDSAAGGEVDREQVADALIDIHANVVVRGAVLKNYLIKTHRSLPGSQRDIGTPGKPSRLDVFKGYVAEYPFVFKATPSGDGFFRVDCDLRLFTTLVRKHGVAIIGNIHDFPVVFDVHDEQLVPQEEIDQEFVEEDDVPCLTQMVNDEECGEHLEVVDLDRLKAYADRKTDRRLRQLRRYIARADSDGFRSEDYPGMVCLNVTYVRKHGIPGRRYSVGPSLQILTREARSVACGNSEGGTKCFDIDFQSSVPTMCAILARELGVDAQCHTLMRYIQHPKAWREFLGDLYEIPDADAKKLLLRVFFGGKPLDGNPMLWGLVHDCKLIREACLASPRYVYLADKFGRRPRPSITRFAYTAFAKEDGMLDMLVDILRRECPAVTISALLFDGCILTPKASAISPMDGVFTVLQKFYEDTGVKVVVKPWDGAH